jgi:predicted small secreted protein
MKRLKFRIRIAAIVFACLATDLTLFTACETDDGAAKDVTPNAG